jgi:hypothetical protein
LMFTPCMLSKSSQGETPKGDVQTMSDCADHR